MTAPSPRPRSPLIARPRAWALAAVAALVVAASPAEATTFRTYGFGPRSMALGGAMTAHVEDYTATFYNPAGLMVRRTKDYAIGVQYVDVDVSASNSSPVPEGAVRDADAFPIDDAAGLFGGMRFPLPFGGSWADRVAMGLSFYTTLPSVVDIGVPFGFTPQFALLGGQTDLMLTQPALGFRLTDHLRAGVGMIFFADVGGNLEIPTGVRGADGVDDARTTIDQELQPVIRATAGLQVDGSILGDEGSPWQLGVTWRDAFSLPLTIPVTVTLGPIPLNIDLTASLLYTPMQVVTGVSYRTDDWLFAADLSWNKWSSYEAGTLELALDVTIPIIPIDLKDSVNPDPGTHDTWTPRLGVEWRAWHSDGSDLKLRAGYAFEPTPFPEQTQLTSFLDGDRHLFSAGVGLRLAELPEALGPLGGEVELDLGVQYDWIDTDVHRKERVHPLFVDDGVPFAFPPIEDSEGRPIADPGFPSIEGDASVLVVMFSITTSFDVDGPSPAPVRRGPSLQIEPDEDDS